jgi:hypothetical protein
MSNQQQLVQRLLMLLIELSLQVTGTLYFTGTVQPTNSNAVTISNTSPPHML